MLMSPAHLSVVLTIALQPVSAPGPTPLAPAATPRIVSPEVAADRRVTFRLRAPRATEVLVRGLFFADRVPLVKNTDGVWSATVGPVAPGIYEYRFSVDGLSTVDPANPTIQPAAAPEVSVLEVPGSPALVTEFQDVPHGTVHAHHYRAKSLQGRARRLQVYTPPGYERGPAARLPTLYLLHGSGDNDATWSVYGRANFVLDNLLAQGAVKPMVVVMPDGHSVPRGTPSLPGHPATDNTAVFIQELLTDVMPLVEKTYRVRTDAAGRAIVGLSMGGRQALTAGLNHPERFAWVAGMSSSVPPEVAIAAALADPRAINKKLRWLWIGCGKDDSGFARNQQFVALLAEKGITHTWKASDGGHDWPVWRGYLAEIAPLLFGARK